MSTKIQTNTENKAAAKKVQRPGDEFVQSFARGLAVIRTFNAQNPQQTLTQVAKAAGLTRAGARRILLTLVHLGYVEVEERLFRLTPKILDLGFAYLTSMPFWNLAEPVMEELVEKVSESSSVGVLEGDEVVYVLRVPAKKIMTVSLSIGSRLPALWTSLGRVLLSGLSDDEVLEIIHATSCLEGPTAAALSTPEELMNEIRQVREQGWAIVNQELEKGLISMAAPILDRQGKIIAAINLSCNAQRTSVAQVKKEFLELLLDAASRITYMLLRH